MNSDGRISKSNSGGRRLPPLSSLRAFEAAARHLSFKRAADELNVTPAAVSQQIKTLESYCGRPLFRRMARALELTEAGRAALAPLSDAFDLMAEAVGLMAPEEDSGLLTVSVPPSFGAKWLLPRLDKFNVAYPDFDLRLDATDRLADFLADGVDVAVRYGRGDYPGLEARLMMDETTFPVCSPSLYDGAQPIRKPEDLLRHTLLHVEWQMLGETAPSWEMWLSAAGVTGANLARGPRFTAETMAVQAAIAGQGVALAEGAIVADDLAQGRLVRPFPPIERERSNFSYYIVYPPRNVRNPKVRAFIDWAMAEVAEM